MIKMVKETRFISIPVKKNAANCFEKDFFILMSIGFLTKRWKV